MAILKNGPEIDRFLDARDVARPILLLYGPDYGLVSERAQRFVAAQGVDLNDAFSVARLDGDQLAGDPARLADEAGTIGLFGGRRVIRVRQQDRAIHEAVSRLLAAPLADVAVLIEAGDLKKSSPLRTLVEKSEKAVAIACYLDGDDDLRRLIQMEMREAALTIDAAASAALLRHLGGDRAASRGEIRKLCLYCAGTGRVTADDVAAAIGDASTFVIDDIVDAAFGGDAASLDRLLVKAAATKTGVAQILSAANRHALQLHRARAAMEAGAALDSALGRFEPPLFFRRKPIVERQARRWTAARLTRAIERLAEALLETRRKPDMDEALANRALMALAVIAAGAQAR